MEIRYGQLGYTTFTPVTVDRVIRGSNNYKTYYQNEYKGICLSKSEVYTKLIKEIDEGGGPRPFFGQLEAKTSNSIGIEVYNTKFRRLILEFIIKNNLSSSIVGQSEFLELIKYLSPQTLYISRRTLMRDLIAEWYKGDTILKASLYEQVDSGGRIALITDA